jgi:hypothetical protein
LIAAVELKHFSPLIKWKVVKKFFRKIPPNLPLAKGGNDFLPRIIDEECLSSPVSPFEKGTTVGFSSRVLRGECLGKISLSMDQGEPKFQP